MEKIINVFGSSIAWGACDNEQGGWVNRLRNYLADREEDYCEVYNLGIGGDNSNGLLKRFQTENEARTPNVIMIGIGLNDSQYINSKDNPRVPLPKFKSNLLELIKQAKKFTKEIIFIGLTRVNESKTMPVAWDTTKYYDNKNIALYDTKVKEVCEKNNLPFIPMHDLLGNEDLFKDGLHPNSKGHEKMFQRVKDFLIANKIV